jgi:hypothetical protein
LSQVLKGQHLKNSSDILARHALGALLTLAAAELSRAGDAERILRRLHEQIEYFCETVPLEQVCADLELLNPQAPPLAAEIFKALPAFPPLDQSMKAVQGTPTTRQQLQRIIKAHEQVAEPPADLPILLLPSGRDFAAKVAMGRTPIIKPVAASTSGCPHCHLKLPLATLAEVDRDRFATCVHCGKFLIAAV